MPNPLSRATPLAVTLLLVLGCGEDAAGPGPDPNPDPEPGSALRILPAPEASGQGQAGLRGTVLPEPLRVLVTLDGAPVAGEDVSWSVTSGPAGASVTTLGPTDANGIAEATVQLSSTQGRVHLRAELDNGRTQGFWVMAEPAQFAILSGDRQVSEVMQPLAEPVRVRAHYGGVPLPGEAVEWGGQGTVQGDAATDAAGEATVRLTAGPRAGDQTFWVRSAADYSSTAIGVTGTPAAPTRFTETGGYGGVVGVPGEYGGGGVGGRVTDAYGNTVPGGTVSWRVGGTGRSAVLEQGTTTANPDGYASVAFWAANSTDDIVIVATLSSGVEVPNGPYRAFDITYVCPWGCYVTRPSITRPVGYRIRFGGAENCSWQGTPVAGWTGVVPTEFTVSETGTYTYACLDTAYGPTTGQIEVTP